MFSKFKENRRNMFIPCAKLIDLLIEKRKSNVGKITYYGYLREVTSENALLEKKQATLTGRPTISGKPHFGSHLGLLGLNLGHKTFFGSFSSTRC